MTKFSMFTMEQGLLMLNKPQVATKTNNHATHDNNNKQPVQQRQSRKNTRAHTNTQGGEGQSAPGPKSIPNNAKKTSFAS